MPKQRRLGRPPRKRRKAPLDKFRVRALLLTPAQDAWLQKRAEAELRSVSSYTRWLFNQLRREEGSKKDPEAATA